MNSKNSRERDKKLVTSVTVHPGNHRLQPAEFFEIAPSGITNSRDFQEVLDLYAKEFSGPSEPSIPKVIELVQQGIFRVLIMTQPDLPNGKHVSAFAMISSYEKGSYLHLEYFAVNGGCRGKGVGSWICKSLVRFLEKDVHSKVKAPKFLSLECEERLTSFYSRMGWLDVQLPPLVSKVSSASGGVEEKPFHFLAHPLGDSLSTSSLFSKINFRSVRNFLSSCWLDNLKSK